MTAARPLVIIGIGDFGRIARFYLEQDSQHRVVAHAVSAGLREHDQFLGLPLVALEDLPRTHPPEEFDVQIGIAYSRVNRNRQEMFETAKSLGYRAVTYVCSKAITWNDLDAGEGAFIFEANVIGAGTLILNDVPDGTIVKGAPSAALPIDSASLHKI